MSINLSHREFITNVRLAAGENVLVRISHIYQVRWETSKSHKPYEFDEYLVLEAILFHHVGYFA